MSDDHKTLTINVNFTGIPVVGISEVLKHLHQIEGFGEMIKTSLEKIMSSLDDANAAIAKIDAATTKQGQVLATEADTLQKISDEMDAIIAAGNVPPETVAQLQALADKAQGVSDSLDSQAAFATAIAAKGVTNPVPVPVPPPTA